MVHLDRDGRRAAGRGRVRAAPVRGRRGDLAASAAGGGPRRLLTGGGGGGGGGGRVACVFAAGDGVGHLWRREDDGGEFDPVKPPADLDSRRAGHSWSCAVDAGEPAVCG